MLATVCLLFIEWLNCMQHCGGAPLPAYEPVYNWRATRASVFGQRLPELPSAISTRLDINLSVRYCARIIEGAWCQTIHILDR